MSLPLIDNFHSIVLENRPLLDVRAPVEFVMGAFPNSTNIAILDNKQRHLVGICYKEKGHDEAVALGRKLVNVDIQAQLVQSWKSYIQQNPNAYLYCFRGGQRSTIAQTWLDEAGVTVPRLKGGYKAFRHFLIEQSTQITSKAKTIIIGGRTGSGKTNLLQKLSNSIDLEAIAKHRGSSFGKFITAQPSQIDFENALYYKILQQNGNGHKQFVIEHESKNIGRLYIPKSIFENFNQGSLVILHTALQERVEITYKEYVIAALQEYSHFFKESGKMKWYEDVNGGLDRIKKRLGSERYLKIKAIFAQHFENGNDEGHKEWIEILLHEYYDPMYDFQLKKSRLPVLYEGNAQEVYDYLKV